MTKKKKDSLPDIAFLFIKFAQNFKKRLNP